MKPIVRWIAVLGCLFGSLLGADTAIAQKSGGVLKIYHRDSPASMSILEEGTNSTEIPMMGVFNNLVMYDQHVAQNSLSSIVPDLATDWSTSEDGTQLTFHLRKGVKWHDGQPFTARDVKCTWDLLTGKASEKLRLNPRKSWYNNIEAITTNGDHEATFALKRPQPWLIALLASGYAPVYPCHVSPRDMRTHPIGTGRSNSLNSSRTNGSPWRGTLITGRRAGPFSTASNIGSFQTARRRCLPLSLASST